LLFLATSVIHADPVGVRHTEGTYHGFLTLRTLEGKTLANGELIQVAHGERVTSRLIFRFRDGSLDDETTVFTQRATFQLISDHHIQRGDSFPQPIDILVEKGKVTARSKDKNGQEKVDVGAIEMPPDTSNGLPLILLLNIRPTDPETKVAFIAPSSKPRLVHISIKPAGETTFSAGGIRHKATEFVLHIEIGGIAGVVAPIVGKKPADTRVWILGGSAPAFIREEGQFYVGGPIWRVDQIAPTLGH
jgi:hypothetical protein